MKSLVSLILVALTMAGLVSSRPISQTVTPSTEPEQGPGKVPINMIVLHFPGTQEGEDKKAVDGGKAHEQPFASPPAKQRGFAVMSSSRSSNYAVVTPIQERSETPSSNNSPLTKRNIGLHAGEETQLMKRAFMITISPIFRQTSNLIRNSVPYKGVKKYVVKPVGRGVGKVVDQIKENNRQYELEKKWSRGSYSPHGSPDWHGEHYYGDGRRRNDWDSDRWAAQRAAWDAQREQ